MRGISVAVGAAPSRCLGGGLRRRRRVDTGADGTFFSPPALLCDPTLLELLANYRVKLWYVGGQGE